MQESADLAYWRGVYSRGEDNMAKSKRKRRIKEQDFKKVKLKVGKRLPKGQNVTDATFKSRSIVLPSQMSKDGTPTNQRKQTLKVQYGRFGNA